MKYPVHTVLLVLCGAGILLTSIYDDVLYPVDDGLTSIGVVVVLVITLASLMRRVRRDEARRKAERAAPPH